MKPTSMKHKHPCGPIDHSVSKSTQTWRSTIVGLFIWLTSPPGRVRVRSESDWAPLSSADLTFGANALLRSSSKPCWTRWLRVGLARTHLSLSLHRNRAAEGEERRKTSCWGNLAAAWQTQQCTRTATSSMVLFGNVNGLREIGITLLNPI